MKKTKPRKPRPRKKTSQVWLLSILLGVLAILAGTLIWSNHSQHNIANHLEPVSQPIPTTLPVYETPPVAPHQTKDVLKIAAPEPATVEHTEYQYTTLKEHGIALVIDDVGYDLPALRRILSLKIPVAISIIPDSPHAKEAAEIAHHSGQMVMLHMPMEPANPHYRERMDDSFLRADMSEGQIKAMLKKGLAKVPYVQGINNHMGSFLTSMQKPMAWLMTFCRKNQLFFIDSKTSSKSVASDIAQQHGLDWGERRVFLDHSIKEEDMKQAWAQAERYAKQQGGCIIIAHPHPETLRFLEQHAAHLQTLMMRNVTDLLHTPHS